MASNLKKAGSVIKNSFRSKRYSAFDIDENMYTDVTPNKRANRFSYKNNPDDDSRVQNQTAPEVLNETAPNQTGLKRSSSVSQSMREAVGTIRQKFRMSTRRLARMQNQTTPNNKVGKRRHTLGGRDVKMSSPFLIETPKRTENKPSLSVETPTRLRREVEDLTANMQALSALTPNTLSTRARRAPAPQPPPRTKKRSTSTLIH